MERKGNDVVCDGLRKFYPFVHLEVDDRVLALLLSADLETLASLDDLKGTVLARGAL